MKKKREGRKGFCLIRRGDGRCKGEEEEGRRERTAVNSELQTRRKKKKGNREGLYGLFRAKVFLIVILLPEYRKG